MSAMTAAEAQAVLEGHDLIAIGARADEQRRRRHGTRTTFVRVFDVHVDAVPAGLPASMDAGEIRVTGQPSSVESAAEAVTRALAFAGPIPVSAFSLADVWGLAGGSMSGFREVLTALKNAGLEAIAEAPVDMDGDPAAAIAAARDTGIQVRRLTVCELVANRRVELVERARDVQSSLGGFRAFAPLPRVSSIAQPSTGYDDVKQVAIARLVVDNIDSIQVDWRLYGPKLAQVALTMGADDVDGVSPFEGDLGHRRSPLEEIRGNIRAAALEPVERNGRFESRA